MITGPHKGLVAVLSAVLTAWSVLLFFQGAYFAAGFYGVPVPWFAAWVGQLPIWAFNVIDSAMVVVLIVAIVVSHRQEKRERRRSLRSGRGSVSSLVIALILIFLVAAFLFALGFNLAGLWSNFRHFFGF